MGENQFTNGKIEAISVRPPSLCGLDPFLTLRPDPWFALCHSIAVFLPPSVPAPLPLPDLSRHALDLALRRIP